MRTFAVLLPLTVIGQMVTAVMRVDEKVQVQANLMTVSAIVAICWLALSTFVLKFGVMGAGVYYGLSIGIWAIGIFWFIGGKKSQLQISLADLKLDLAVCGQILKIGFPFFLVQGATFIFNTVANSLLGSLGGDMGSLYIAAFGVINGYILYITMMVAQCFSYGLQPIAAFNAGAKAWARLKETLSCTLKYQVVTLALVTVALWLAATPVCAFFAAAFGWAWVKWQQSGTAGMAVFAAALFGGLVGFLVYNHYPAKVFMGDTGSLFLGGAVCGMAFALDMPLILILVGIIYIIETLSDIIQVTYFKATHGKRIFRMAPLHHHLEMGGWNEKKVVFVFASISLVFCILAFFGVMGRFPAL